MDLESAPAKTEVGSSAGVTAITQVLTGLKYFISTVLTISAITYICSGIGEGKAMLSGPPVVHFLILGFVLVLLAYLEGLQVAILALASTDGAAWKDTHPRAYALHTLVNHGKNVQRFLVGRQFYVVFVVFLCSQVTTFPSFSRPDVFPAGLWVALVETGLPGALLVLAFGQLMPQLIAANHPVTFCNLRGAITVLRITLILEALGITHFSWLLTAIVSRACGLKAVPSSTSDSTAEAIGKQTQRTPSKEQPTQESLAAACTSFVDRLARIQLNWRASKQAERLDLFGTALLMAEETLSETPAQEFFITASMAEEGLRSSGVDLQVAQGSCSKSTKSTPKAHIYPTPRDIMEQLVRSGQDVPRFLLPPDHELHVPPHIVAYSLMSGVVGDKDQL